MKFYPLNLFIIVISIIYTVSALNKSDCSLYKEWLGFKTSDDDNECCNGESCICDDLNRINNIFM